MKDIFITYAKRTPIGKYKGALSGIRVDDLLAHVFRDLKSTFTFDPLLIDDVIVGCANQAGEDNRNLARMSLVLAGFPFDIPGTTINRLCGSSLDAVISAYSRIQAGLGDCVVVGGAEGMSRAPFALAKAESAYDSKQAMFDTALGWRFPNPAMEKIFPLMSMGETAEEVALKLSLSREEQDRFAFDSHQKAVRSQELKLFDKEILPVPLPSGKNKGEVTYLSSDEGPRKDTTLEKLATLKPVFRQGGSVTAGNSSTLNDGAVALLVVSEMFLKRHDLTPLARITGAGVRGVHPNIMGLGPVAAVKNLCERFQKKISQFDLIELNEAFAAQSLGCMKELGLDSSKVNQQGGAIALGHPLGCSGGRILTSLIHQLQASPSAKEGLATMCIGVGQGIAVSVEKT